MQAICAAALAEAARSQDAVGRHRHAGRAALRACAQGRASWSACAAPASPIDGLYYVESVTSTLKRGEFKQSFNLTRNGTDLHHADGAGMSDGRRTTASTAAWCSTTSIPMQQGRLQVQVPDVAGLAPASWAMPCVPVAGIQNGMFALPIIGSGVWVEFEQGDPDYPIWVGCFWGSAAEVPALALADAAGPDAPSPCRRRCRTA